MGLVFCVFAFFTALLVAQKGLGHGLGYVLAIGSIYGWLRCNFLDGFTHFTFDCALLGLYLSILPQLAKPLTGEARILRSWIGLLVLWPFIVILLSPFLDAQHVFIQFVGLRNALLFLPAALLGSALDRDQFEILSTWCVVIVFGISLFAAAELIVGIEAFYPLNSASRLIYASRDVAHGQLRIPSSFSSAHAYGGTLVALLPFIVHRLVTSEKRNLVSLVALVLTALGVFVCGARSPVVILGVVATVTVFSLRRRPAAVLALVIAAGMVAYFVRQSDRLQRYETLSDTEMVEDRVAGSVNLTFFEVISDYPLGKGLGGATGTSIPYFLDPYAIPQVGIESEYSRLALEEGILGLLLWVGYVFWTLLRSPFALTRFGGVTDRAIWTTCWCTWLLSLIGTGTMAAIPGSLLLSLSMGAIGAQAKERGEVRIRSGAGAFLT
jgi:hypothetical protein